MRRRFTAITLLACALNAAARAAAPAAADPQEFYTRKIQPLLSERCYKCHSIEGHKSKGDLTLDTREGMLKGGKNGRAIVPGNPAKSRIIKAITSSDPDIQMPPKDDRLSAAQVADLKAWIQMGAPTSPGK